MANYKRLEDYCVSPGPNAFKKIHAMISDDFRRRVIDRENFDELLEDLRIEIEEARIERNLASG